MKHDKTPITPADALHALRADGQTGLPLETQSRLAARLHATALLGASLSATSTPTSQVVGPTRASLAPEPAASAVDRLAALLGNHPVASLIATLSLGATLGAFGHSLLAQRPSGKLDGSGNRAAALAIGPQQPPPLVKEPAVGSIDDLPLEAEPPRGTRLPNTRHGKPSPINPASSASLGAPDSVGEQLAMLERVRSMVRRGDASGALRLLAVHARAYPTSTLGEEREALTVKALLHAGRVEEAKTRLVEFEGRYPGSLMLSALKGALVGGGTAARTAHEGNAENP